MFHRMIATGEMLHGDSALDQCLTCGGVWLSRIWDSAHYSVEGDHATDCTGLTDSCHHYDGECPLFPAACKLDVDCNCLHCES